MLSSMRLCSNVPSQYIIKYALGDYTKTDDLLLPGDVSTIRESISTTHLTALTVCRL